MKKLLLILTLSGFAAAALAGVDRYYTSPFTWYSPEIQAQGGSYLANAEGFNALLTNPAAFIKTKEKQKKNGETVVEGELTVLSIGGSYAGNIFEFQEEYRENPDDIIGIILGQVTDVGLGAAVEIGAGYVGRGFGIGLLTVLDTTLPQAETTLGIEVDITSTTGIIAGYAHPFDLGPVKLVAGADVRPMYRILIPRVGISTITDLFGDDDDDDSEDWEFSDLDAFSGFGVGFDAGADVYWQDFIFSLVMRDIGNTRYFFKPLETLGSISFAEKDKVDGVYITPWTLNVGAAYNPIFGSFNRFLDFTVHAAFSQPLILEDEIYNYRNQSFWTKLDLGAEVTLLSSVALRAGLQGGYFTAGFGLDLLILELNGALYAEELGANAGVKPRLGGGLELAFRY